MDLPSSDVFCSLLYPKGRFRFLLFSLYTSSLSDIASKYELSFHFYADDRQFYVTFETPSLNDMELSKCRLEACVLEASE